MLSLEVIITAVRDFFVSHPITAAVDVIVVGTIVFAVLDYFIYHYPKRTHTKKHREHN